MARRHKGKGNGMIDGEKSEQRAQYYRALFDAFPHPTLIVDGDVQIQDFNTAAERHLGPEPPLALRRRGGEAFHCIHAGQNGCGRGQQCRDCVIRNSIREALLGKDTYRHLHKAELRTAQGIRDIDLLVTSSLLPYAQPPQVMLVLEDVGEFRKPAQPHASPPQRHRHD